jgi:hypothetical protein
LVFANYLRKKHIKDIQNAQPEKSNAHNERYFSEKKFVEWKKGISFAHIFSLAATRGQRVRTMKSGIER